MADKKNSVAFAYNASKNIRSSERNARKFSNLQKLQLQRTTAFQSAAAPAVKSGTIKPKSSFFADLGASVIAGSLHAIIEQPVSTPIEASITQTQINGKSFFWNFGDLLKKGALYRALPAALAGAVPKACIHYSILNIWINAIAPDGDIRKADTRQSTIIGMGVGASEVVLTNPINFVKFRMQRPEWGYKDMGDAIKTIYKTEGLKAFWLGTHWTFLRNTICNGGMVGGYKAFEQLLTKHAHKINPNTKNFVAGSCGGVIGSFFAYPFEMLRAAEQQNVNFMSDIASKGPGRMLSGWLPGACRLVLTSAIMGSIIPRLKDISRKLVSGEAEEKAQAQKDKSAK
mmetsp:Transcript_17535/g.29052  ORF Transcript_17535/g.29052 Transcript_17535/m.29052 type:complete len:343 (+) Transcript_17535:54-1082(+)